MIILVWSELRIQTFLGLNEKNIFIQMNVIQKVLINEINAMGILWFSNNLWMNEFLYYNVYAFAVLTSLTWKQYFSHLDKLPALTLLSSAVYSDLYVTISAEQKLKNYSFISVV